LGEISHYFIYLFIFEMPFATCGPWLDSLLRNLVYVACVVEDIRYEEEPPEPDVEVIFLTYFLSPSSLPQLSGSHTLFCLRLMQNLNMLRHWDDN
jgi:hypothetical protein